MDNNIQKALESIAFVKKDNWFRHQICGDFPIVDVRCLTFCCSPAKPCMLRNLVLKKLNLTLEDYVKIKEKSATDFEKNLLKNQGE